MESNIEVPNPVRFKASVFKLQESTLEEILADTTLPDEVRHLAEVYKRAMVPCDVLGKLFGIDAKTLVRTIYNVTPAGPLADTIYRKIPKVLSTGLEYGVLPCKDRETIYPIVEMCVRLLVQGAQLQALAEK